MRASAAAPFCALLCALPAGAAEMPVDGIAIGSSIGGVARALGAPASVASSDSGHRFAFGGGVAAYADDDGIVLAVDARAGAPRVDVDGTVRAFPIGTYSTAKADAELADVAEFAAPGLRSYRLAPRRDLVLGFEGTPERLVRVTYGEPGQLARLGLLPGDDASRAVVYRAPVLRASAAATARKPLTGGNIPVNTGAAAATAIGSSAVTETAETPSTPSTALTGTAGSPSAAVYRLAIDRGGSVRSVDIVLGSGSPSADAQRALHLAAGRYTPATLDGRPIAATIFVELPR